LILVPPFHNVIDAHSTFTTAAAVPVSAIGWTAICGVPFTAICNVPIFLALGGGVANCFIIYDAFHSQDASVDMPERAGKALAESGPFGLMTTITTLIAFGSGINTPYPAMLWFALYAMAGLSLSYIHSLLSHTAHLAFSVQARRKKLKPGEPEPLSGQPDEGCLGRLPLSSCGKPLIAKMLAPSGRTTVFGTLMLCMGLAVWGMSELEQGIEDVTNVPYNSGFARFFKTTSSRLPVGGPEVNVMLIADEHALASSLQNQLVDLESALSTTKRFAGFVINPWSDYRNACRYFESLLAPETGDCFHNTSTLKSSLYKLLYVAPFNEAYRIHAKMIDHDVDHQLQQVTAIRAVRMQYALESMSRQDQRYADLKERNDVIAKSGQFTINPIDVISQSLPAVVPDTIINCGVGAVAVMVSLLFFLPASVVVIVLCCVLLIDLLLLGWIKLFGMALNLATSVCMSMAIGFAIDYSSDISFAFHLATGSNVERASSACANMAKPIFTGGMSSILSCVPLLFALAPAGPIFATMVIGTVVVGVFIGCIILPVAMATFVPDAAVKKFAI